MNSIFTLGLAIRLTVQDTTMGTTVANLGMAEKTFPKPVFAGDAIRAKTIDGKMFDIPHLKAARKTLAEAGETP